MLSAMSVCIIKDLLAKAFSSRSFNEKTEIIKTDRPTPDLLNLTQQSGKFTRHFQSSMYSTCEWLAGSAKLIPLFCWYCLLFGKDRNLSLIHIC